MAHHNHLTLINEEKPHHLLSLQPPACRVICTHQSNLNKKRKANNLEHQKAVWNPHHPGDCTVTRAVFSGMLSTSSWNPEMLPRSKQCPSSLWWMAFSSLLTQESWKHIGLVLVSLSSPHLQTPHGPERSRFQTWNNKNILVLKSVLKSAKSALLNLIDRVSNSVRARWVLFLLEKK